MNTPVSQETIREALAYVSPDCDREEWAKIAMALKSELDSGGFELFDTWSQQGQGYNKQDVLDTWRSVNGAGGVSIGTLLYMAKESGWNPKDSQPPAQEEIAKRKEIQVQRKAKEAEERKQKVARQSKTKSSAVQRWELAQPITEHPYLSRKKVNAYSLRIEGDALLIPMVDPDTGELWNIQSIYPSPRLIRASKEPRDKDIMPGGKKIGLCHHIAGDDKAPVVIVEGYATGATIHELTGVEVYIAFDSGNLKNIAGAVRGKEVNRAIIIAADNDQFTKGNPGIKKAKEAAKLIKGRVAVPMFPKPIVDRVKEGDKGPTDFNDLLLTCGPEEAKKQLLTATQDRCATLPRGFTLSDSGLYYDDPENPQGACWVCSPLKVTAVTRDDRGKEWGRLLVFTDMDGKVHRWSMPMSMLSGDGNECRRVLLDGGLRLGASSRARNLLSQYIQSCDPDKRARSVTRTGWYENVYVLPEEVIGERDGQEVLLQTTSGDILGYGSKGSLEAWRDEVASLCVRNSRLTLAVSTAFAPVLLELMGIESGGFHFRGNSSIGKSTMLYVASSVWGGRDRVRRFRTTDNGLEGLAQMHNDSLLCLDELKELDPKIAGSVIYMLANGQGKQRAGRVGEQRPPATWRLLFLSTGELSIADHIKDGGGRVYAGQEVRIADVEADAGLGLGVFEALHGMESGVHLSQYLAQATKRNYGHASKAFIERVVEDMGGVAIQVQEMRSRFSAEFVPLNADGQVHRVADRYALVAAAGELATAWGITGWERGEAAKAAQICLTSWVKNRGGMDKKEDGDVVRQVKRFLQEHGDARFVRLDDDSNNFRTQYRAGYRGNHNGEHVFYVLGEVFTNEVIKGFDFKFAGKVLKEKGYLCTNEGKRLTFKMSATPDDGTRPRVYAINAKILEDE